MTTQRATGGLTSGAPIRIGIVGLGKIARDQHIPALLADPRYRIIAVTTTSSGSPLDVPLFRQLGDMIDATPDLQAVTLCTPPQGRHALARQAIEKNLHVMLEKPPGVTVCEVDDLAARARLRGVTLFASWHSRATPSVEAARLWLAERQIRKARVIWKEDVRKWHPGQRWIWQAGGLGVFDPGINALSVLTRVMPRPVFITGAELFFPSNCDTPIAANLSLADGAGVPIEAEFDFRQTGDESWDVLVETDAGQLALRRGGAAIQIDGRDLTTPSPGEYPLLYQHFANLVSTGAVDVDLAPLRLVADAFLMGRRVAVEPFHD